MIPVAGSYGITFRCAELGWPRVEYATARLRNFLRAHQANGELYLMRHPEIGSPMQEGVRYIREPMNEEEWEEIPIILAHGGADCEDLACWLAAWYRVRKRINARAIPIAQRWPTPGGRDGILFHIVVELPDGRRVDPSKLLGMKGSA